MALTDEQKKAVFVAAFVRAKQGQPNPFTPASPKNNPTSLPPQAPAKR